MAVFDSSGRLNANSRHDILSRQNEGEDEISWCVNFRIFVIDVHRGLSEDAESFMGDHLRSYVNQVTGWLDADVHQ